MAQPPEWWSFQSRSWQRSAYLLSDGEPDEGYSPSGCCNQTECDHLPAVYRRRSISADLGECPPYPGSWLWHSQWSLMAQPPEWLFCQWGFWRRSAYLLSDEEPDEGCSPSGCCNQKECGHLLAAFQRRWASAGQGGFLPCPESWPWHSRWNQRAQPRGW